jgi:hypothetical protein
MAYLAQKLDAMPALDDLYKGDDNRKLCSL